MSSCPRVLSSWNPLYLLPTLACRRLVCWRRCSCSHKMKRMWSASKRAERRRRQLQLRQRRPARSWRRAAALDCGMPLPRTLRQCGMSWRTSERCGQPGGSWWQPRPSGWHMAWSWRRRHLCWPAKQPPHHRARRRPPAAGSGRRGWSGRVQPHRWPLQQEVGPSRAGAPRGRQGRQPSARAGKAGGGAVAAAAAGMGLCERAPSQTRSSLCIWMIYLLL